MIKTEENLQKTEKKVTITVKNPVRNLQEIKIEKSPPKKIKNTNQKSTKAHTLPNKLQKIQKKKTNFLMTI